MLAFTGCSVNVVINGNGNTAEVSDRIEYSFATKDEGIELLMSNKEYHDGFTQNDLDFRMQKKDAVMDEYLDFAKDQVLDFTEEEKSAIDRIMSEIEDKIRENGYVLPKIDPIVFISTTQKEEGGTKAYRHGTQI